MAISDIVNSIIQSAQAKQQELLKQGDDELEQVKQQWVDKLTVRRKKVLDQWQQQADRQVNRSILQLKNKAQGKLLLKKQELIDDVFDQSLKKLAELPEAEQVDMLVKLIDNLPEIDGELHPVGGNLEVLTKALAKSSRKLPITDQEVEGVGGFIFESQEVTVDNKLEKLLSAKKDELKVSLGSILFKR